MGVRDHPARTLTFDQKTKMLTTIKSFFAPKPTAPNENWYCTKEYRWEPIQQVNNYVKMRLQQKYVDFHTGKEEWRSVFPISMFDTQPIEKMEKMEKMESIEKMERVENV